VIFILAGTYDSARKWAKAQQLTDDEWFSSLDIADLYGRQDFHVIVLENAGELPPILFEKLFNLAQARGRQNRK
jgi:hypothetical protein